MGIELASYWTTLAPKGVHSYAYNAFAMFRNYDGAGGKFGNISVGAQSSYANVHAYAATDSVTSPTKLWIMLVNTGTGAQSNMTISISNFTTAGSAKVYQSVNGAAPAAAASVSIANGSLSGISIAETRSCSLLQHGERLHRVRQDSVRTNKKSLVPFFVRRLS